MSSDARQLWFLAVHTVLNFDRFLLELPSELFLLLLKEINLV